MFTNLGYVSTKALRGALVVALGATLAALMAVALVATSGTAVGQQGQAATQPLYEVHDLGTLEGGTFSYAFGINEAGKVVGVASLNENPELGAGEHPFLYSDGVMQDLGTLGGRSAVAADINDADKVVGSSTTNAESFERHAFLYSGGQMQDLGTLQGHSESFATAINNKDEVVGGSSMSQGLGQRAFLYSSGVMQDLGTLGGTVGTIDFGSYATGINEAGKVVGGAATSNNEVHAFLYSDGVMSDLGTLGGSSSDARDINEADKVVGSSTTSNNELHTFLYSGGQMQDLGTLEEPYNSYSFPMALNNADQVVGQSATTEGDFEHPFLYSDGVMRDLNSLIPADSSWELLNVEDINDNGYIVGKAQHKEDGREHAFLLTPLTAPYVTDTSPNDGDGKVSRTTEVTATFSEEVQQDTLTTANVQLFSGNSKKPVKATLSPTSTSVTLTPSSKLDANTTHRAVVGTGVKDLADNALDQDQDPNNGNQPKQWTFTTGPK